MTATDKHRQKEDPNQKIGCIGSWERAPVQEGRCVTRNSSSVATPYGYEPNLPAKSGLDYLDARPFRDEAAISYDCEVEVEVQCRARAWSERGVDHVRLNAAGTS